MSRQVSNFLPHNESVGVDGTGCRLCTGDHTRPENRSSARGHTPSSHLHRLRFWQDRPELAQMVAYLWEGDTVVHSMDRPVRNLEDLRRLVRELIGKGVRIQFLKEGLTFTAESSPMSQLLLNVMGSFAEFERALIRERQREGIAVAKRKGVYEGRKCSVPTAGRRDARRCRRWGSHQNRRAPRLADSRCRGCRPPLRGILLIGARDLHQSNHLQASARVRAAKHPILGCPSNSGFGFLSNHDVWQIVE